MKAPIVIKIKSLKFFAPLIVVGVLLTTGRALAVVEVWNGGNFVSVTTNWSDTANWLPPGIPGSADTAVFGATGTGTDGVTVNNALTANTTVAGLQYTNTTSGAWHVTQIPAGTTLTVTGPMLVGGATNNGLISSVAFVDAGTLSLTGNLTVGNNGSSSADQNTLLDLSGLTNFLYNSSGGTITIGFGNRSSANWKLASVSNSITVGTMNANATSTSSGVSGTITLGGGTNIINVGTLNAAVARNNSTITFPPTGGAGLRLRGVGGTDTDRATLILANRNQNTSGGNNTGTFNFNGNSVDMKFGTMTIGEGTAATPSASQSGIGIINFDTGIIDATTINMAISTANANNIGTGTINVGAAATLVVSNLSLVNQGPLATGTSVGNLNINGGGVVNCSGNIVKTTTAGTGNITIATGSLNLGAGSIGTSATPLDTLSVADSTMTLPANLTADVFANTLTAGGSANTINVTSLPTFFTYPVQFPLISFVNVGGDNSTFVVGTLPGTFKGYISNNTSSIDIVITNGPSLQTLKSIVWSGTPTGDWTTNTATLNWLTNSTAVNYNQGDTVTFNDSLTGTTNVNLTQGLTPGGLTVNNSSAHYIFTGAGKISGSTSFTKTGAGTLILDNTGTNDFVGTVTISNGTLQIGNNDANGNLPLQSWDVEGTLAFNRIDNVLLQRVISGAGSLVQNGSGTISLTAANTYSGNTVVNRGTLALTGAGTVANSAQIVAQGGAFDVSAAAPSISLNPVALSSGSTFVVDTNTVNVSTLSSTNSTIRLVANANGPSIFIQNLTTGGTTNYINITGIQNPPGSAATLPIISYAAGNFVGGFNFGLTNFPNAYVTNDTAGNTIDLVLTAAPYTVTWNGGSLTGNNWSDSSNWNGVSIFANDTLFFDGSTRLTPFNDTAAGTTYSNITFNGGASSFTLTGNPITLAGTMENDSPNPQTVNLALDFSNGISINGTAGPLIIGGGLTNTHGAFGFTTNTFMGTGILTNLLSSAFNATNVFLLNDSAANWTLLDNASSTTVTVPWNFEFNNGTFNFGSATSAPKLVSTSAQGSPQDNQIGNSATAVLNFSNGVFTTTARLSTGTGSGNGTINQFGGTFTIGSQFQGANGSASASSTVNLSGGTMNIGSVTNPVGQFYIASRGPGVLTLTNSALLNCGVLDVSRSINANIPGTVNLNGGTIVATSVGTATANSVATTTGSTATFNFNGGVLKARTNSTVFFRGSIVAPIIPITAIVQAGGAIIDSDVFNITDTDPLLTDPNLLGAPDGGFKKLGTGTLTMLGTNTYIGDTLVTVGTLIVNGVQGQSRVIVSGGATLGGNGVIGSNVTVNAGGTLSPGNNAVGVLTVAGNVSLAGTTTMEVDKVGLTNDLLLATNSTPSTITYGGTLNVATVAGSLAPGDTFKFFSASNYLGSFATINPPNVTWNTSNLNVNGTLTVVSVAPTGPTTNATITSVTLSGTNLLVHGTNNNVPNNTLHYVVLTSTNLQTPLSNWSPVVTNLYNNGGTFDFTNPIVPGTPNQFIDVKALP